MNQHLFDTDEEYVQAQRDLTLRKMSHNKIKVFTTFQVVWAIQRYHRGVVKQGLCHGVRLGGELELFEAEFPGATWIGTEITEELCDGRRILHQDFSAPETSMIGIFDLIYSNSFDHSRDPWKTAKAWLACLSRTGRLYVEWTPWHNRLGRHGFNADCFAATEDEYLQLWNEAGRVEAVLREQEEAFERVIFVVR